LKKDESLFFFLNRAKLLRLFQPPAAKGNYKQPNSGEIGADFELSAKKRDYPYQEMGLILKKS